MERPGKSLCPFWDGENVRSRLESPGKCPIPNTNPPSKSWATLSLGPKFGDQILTMGGGHRRRGGRHGLICQFFGGEIEKMIPMIQVWGGRFSCFQIQKHGFETFF